MAWYRRKQIRKSQGVFLQNIYAKPSRQSTFIPFPFPSICQKPSPPLLLPLLKPKYRIQFRDESSDQLEEKTQQWGKRLWIASVQLSRRSTYLHQPTSPAWHAPPPATSTLPSSLSAPASRRSTSSSPTNPSMLNRYGLRLTSSPSPSCLFYDATSHAWRKSPTCSQSSLVQLSNLMVMQSA